MLLNVTTRARRLKKNPPYISMRGLSCFPVGLVVDVEFCVYPLRSLSHFQTYPFFSINPSGDNVPWGRSVSPTGLLKDGYGALSSPISTKPLICPLRPRGGNHESKRCLVHNAAKIFRSVGECIGCQPYHLWSSIFLRETGVWFGHFQEPRF